VDSRDGSGGGGVRLKSFIVVSVVASAGLVGYGLAALLVPRILFDVFTSRVYAFPPTAIRAIAYQSGLYRLLGYFNLLVGTIGFTLLARWRSLRDPWLLRLLLALVVFAYAGPVVFDVTVGVVGPAEVFEIAILVALLITGALSWSAARRTRTSSRRLGRVGYEVRR
jgi:hypothetical protein